MYIGVITNFQKEPGGIRTGGAAVRSLLQKQHLYGCCLSERRRK